VTVAASPFRGIIDIRPYPSTHLTTARWIAEVAPERVSLASLTLTQRHLRVGGLFGVVNEHSAADPIPHAVAWGDDLYLEDGHHRVVRAALLGETSMMIRVWRARAREGSK
jgi:hypothetical protein